MIKSFQAYTNMNYVKLELRKVDPTDAIRYEEKNKKSWTCLPRRSQASHITVLVNQPSFKSTVIIRVAKTRSDASYDQDS